MIVSACWRGSTRSPLCFGPPGGVYTTVLRTTASGFVLFDGVVVELVAGAAVTVGGVVRVVFGGTVIGGGAAVVGPAGGSGGTGTVSGATVVGVVTGAVVSGFVDDGVLRSERPDVDSDPQAAKTTAPTRASAPTSATANATRLDFTREVCPTERGSERRDRQEQCSGGTIGEVALEPVEKRREDTRPSGVSLPFSMSKPW